jgi:hypothetical protein
LREFEPQLVSKPDEPDEELCAEIMHAVANPDPARVAAEAPASARPHLGLAMAGLAAAAAVIVAAIMLLHEPDVETGTAASAQPSMPDEPREEPVPPAPRTEDPSRLLADALVQQELLQRDAQKLGAHLREHVILFQSME